jgi:16S rRNA (cytosine1402-N4)-methyltransferase
MHESVLLNEVIENLNIKKNGKYIDATVGYGGHSSKILKALKNEGFLFAFDQDDNAVKYSNELLSKISKNFKIYHSNFKNMKDFISEKVDGILFDLGVSSPQLDEEERGFSFHKDAPLDMRMDKRHELSAYEVVNTYTLEQLTKIFFEYGEESYAKSIASNIIKNRPIKTTLELADVISKSVPEKYKRLKHPARKVFQAIRIEVNKELEILEKALLDAFDLLNAGGRIVVITFHSLEDRIVKNTFKKLCEEDDVFKNLPYVNKESESKAKYIVKNLKPSEIEINNNKRSRSATLRIIERIK